MNMPGLMEWILQGFNKTEQDQICEAHGDLVALAQAGGKLESASATLKAVVGSPRLNQGLRIYMAYAF
jgi:hypothetical protein